MTSVDVIQISKMQQRRGLETELPGAPSNIPGQIATPLDIAELALATDSGRLFIGHDPSQGQPNYSRTSFPYTNVEVLTENATGTLTSIFSQNHKTVGNQAYFSATLGQNIPNDSTDWGTVQTNNGNGLQNYQLPTIASFQIEYYVFTTSGTPMKHGNINIMHLDNSIPPIVHEHGVYDGRNDLTNSTGALSAKAVYGAISFRCTEVPGSPPYLIWQYRNILSENLNLLFRISNPTG